MLSPEKANPDHLSEELPLDLEDLSQVKKLPLLQKPHIEEHAPLIRHEWSKRQKALAWALGFATVTTIMNMADREGRAIYDELSGHNEFAVAEEYVEHQGDPLDAMSHQSDSKDRHSVSSNDSPIDALRELERPDFTDLARQADGDPHVPQLPDDLPRTKLPIHIDMNTPKDAVKKQLVNH